MIVPPLPARSQTAVVTLPTMLVVGVQTDELAKRSSVKDPASTPRSIWPDSGVCRLDAAGRLKPLASVRYKVLCSQHRAGQRQIGAQLERGSRAGRGVVAVGDGGGRQAGRERPGAHPGDRSTRLTSRSSAGRCVRKCILTGLSPLSDEQLLDVLAFDVSSALVG